MGPEGPKSIGGPARYDKLPQKTSVKDKLVKKTSVKVGKLVVGEGWPAGPSPPGLLSDCRSNTAAQSR